MSASPQAGSVPATMTAVRVYEHGGPEALRVEQVPVPEPQEGEVLVRIRAASVTWWDLAFRRGGFLKGPPGRKPLSLPFQLGREGVGEVVALGPKTRRYALGDRVVLMAAPACGKCAFCLRGADNLCVDTELPGHTRFGTYAQYVTASEHAVLRAPADLPDDKLACLLWSYPTVLHMVEARGRISPGDAVLITGASSGMGTAGVQLARLAGASPIVALTGSPHKADALLKAGADVVLDYHADDILEQIRRHTRGLGPDVVLDFVGGAMASLGIAAARMGGRVVLVAVMGGTKIELDIREVFARHLDILGARSSTRLEQQRVLELAQAGRIDPVIAARFPLEQARQAHEALESGTQVGKIVLLP